MSVNGNGNSAEYANNSDTMAKLIALENRTGYRMQQFNGQRKFWNPKWDEAIPPRGCEVFVGKIPRDLYEDELVPVFEKIGQIYELRLMMDFSGYNRGYAFVCYTCREHAKHAIEKLDNYEIRPGLRIGVCKSVDNCRLFVNGLPKDKSQQEIRKAMSEVSDDVSDVIVHPGNGPGEKNRGFAFVEYQTHRAAAMARRKLMPGRITIFGSEVVTDWAEPEIDMNDTLSRIKNVYVRNLKLTTTEYAIYYAFNNIRPGAIERVKKIQDRDYAFVHFLKREDALYAVQVMNGQKIDGQEIQVSLAKPPTNKNDTLNSILQTFSIQQKPAATQRPSYPSVGNKTTVQDRLSSFLLRNPSPNPVLNPLNNYSMLSTSELQANANRAQQAAFAHLNGLQLPPPPLPTNFAHHQQQQLNTQKQGGNINGVAPSSGLVHGSSYPQLPTLNNASQNSFTSPLPYSSGVQDCAFNGLNTGSGIQSNQLANGISNNNEELTPVSTLDHIAKIQCPIVYLDEISAMFSGGRRPVYNLFSENCLGKTQYVYRVTFMGNSYIPPSRLYCEDVSEAKNIAARYVIKEADNWIKKQMTAMVNGSQSMMLRSNYAHSRASPALGDASNGNINSKQNNSNNSIFNTNSPLWSTPASSTLLTNFDDRPVEQLPIANNVGGAGDVSNYFPPPNSKATTNGETIFANTTNASDLDSLWEEIRKNQVRTTQASQNFTAAMDRGQANNFNSLYNASLFKQGSDRINQTAAGGFQLQQAAAAAAQQTQQGGNRSSPSVFDLVASVGNDFHSLSIDD